MTHLLKYTWTFVFLWIGAIAGYSYYAFIGCYNGKCMISGNPYISTIYGAVLAYLLKNTFSK